jgi:hypothetical protein
MFDALLMADLDPRRERAASRSAAAARVRNERS